MKHHRTKLKNLGHSVRQEKGQKVDGTTLDQVELVAVYQCSTGYLSNMLLTHDVGWFVSVVARTFPSESQSGAITNTASALPLPTASQ